MLTRALNAAAIALFVCLVLGFGFLEWSASSQPPKTQSHQQNASPSTDKETKSEGKEPVWKPNDPVSLYTLVLAVFTGALVIVSAIQIRYLIRAERLTRRSVIAARQSAIAAKKSADALPTLERAYLFIVPELEFRDQINNQTWDFVYASRVGVTFKLENYGKTPAIVYSIEAHLQVWSDAPDNTRHIPNTILASDLIIEGSKGLEPRSSPLNFEIDEETAIAIRDREAMIWFYGSILYRDVFGRDHATRFRWAYSELIDIFTARGDAPYNERT